MNKKNYLFIVLAALAFTACSNDDEPGVNNGPVAAQVTAGIEGVQTRAAGTSWDKGDQIGITAEQPKRTTPMCFTPLLMEMEISQVTLLSISKPWRKLRLRHTILMWQTKNC